MQGAVPQQAAFPAAIQSAVARCGTGAAHGAVQGEALFTGGGVSGKSAVLQGCCAVVLCSGAVQGPVQIPLGSAKLLLPVRWLSLGSVLVVCRVLRWQCAGCCCGCCKGGVLQTRSITDSVGAGSRQSGLHSWHVRPRSFRTDWRRKKQNCIWHLWQGPVTCGHFHVASAAGCSEHSHNQKCSKRIHPNINKPGKYTWSR